MSWAQILPRSPRLEPVDGGYNIQEGLRDWRRGVAAYGLGDKALAGAGGVDVLVLSDSIFQTGGTFYSVDNVPNRLRQLLQRRFNPTDVEGGYGFMHFLGHPPTAAYVGVGFGNANMLVNGADTDWTHWGPASFSGEAGLSKSICLRHYSVDSSLAGPSQSCLYLYLNSMAIDHLKQDTAASTQRQAQIVYMTGSGHGRFRFGWGDFNGGVIPYTDGAAGYPTYATHIDANAFQVDVDCDAAESVGNRSALANVATSSAATHWLQVDQIDANDEIHLEGVLLYRDDHDCGIRLHNLGIGGALSGDWNNAVTLAGLARFGSRSGSIPGEQSQNAKLVIIELGANDNLTGASPQVSLATYRANLATLIESIQTWASNPSILLVYPYAWENANFASRWRSYINVGKSLASQYNCALLDIWGSMGDAPHGSTSSGFMKDWGFYSDGIHTTKLGHDWMAGLVFGALTSGA